MKKLLLIAALLVGATPVFADGQNQVVSATTRNPHWTITVFNDSGAQMVSGDVVAWDDDDTDYSVSGYPYVILATTADDPHLAGVVDAGLTCADQTMCEIVTKGPAMVKIADASDNATVDTLISSSTSSGLAGDYGTGANTCALGTLIAIIDQAGDGSTGLVHVDVDCN